MWLTATLVTTEREQVRAEARRLVQATAEADEATLARLLHPDARLDTRYRAPEGARQIIQAVADTIPDLGIRSASVPEIRAALIEADAVSSQVRVRLETDTVPPYSWWRVEWQREPPGPAGAWRVTHIELLWVPGMPNR